MNYGAPAAPPRHFDRQLLRLPSSEAVEGVGAGEVATAEHDLLLLDRDRAAQHANLGPSARGIRRLTAQPHRHARGTDEVAEHRRGGAEPIDDDVQSAVPVQVRHGHAVRDRVVGAEPPPLAHVREGEVTVVAEGDARHREFGELRELPSPLQARERRPSPLPGVRVHDIPQVPGRDEQVLVAVEIHVQELGVPRPVRGLNPGEGCDFREAAVAAVLEERIALPLGPVVDPSDQLRQRRVRGDLGLATRSPTQHVRDEDVDLTVAIHIGKINRHRGVAGVAEGETGCRAKRPLPVIQPQEVGVLEIVADVQVRCAVTVHVGELGRQGEVFRRRGEGLARFVEEAPRRPRRQREVSGAVVQVECVRIGALLHRDHTVLRPVLDAIILLELGDDLEALPHLPNDLIESAFLRRVDVHRRPRLIVGHVEVEVAVPVHVRQRHRHAARARGEAGLRRPLGEHPVPVVDEQRHATPQRADEQVQVAVAVHVGQHRSRGVTPRQRDARLGGDVLEPPATQVAVQNVRALVAREIDVGKAVPVHVAQGHAAALRQVAVPERAVEGDRVGEVDAGLGWGKLGEPRTATARHAQLAPPVPRLLVP